MFQREGTNPYYPIVFDDKDPRVTKELGYLDEVLELCIEMKATELLGLSMNDLLQLDRATFQRVKDRLVRYRKKEMEALRNANKDLNNPNNKIVFGGKPNG